MTVLSSIPDSPLSAFEGGRLILSLDKEEFLELGEDGSHLPVAFFYMNKERPNGPYCSTILENALNDGNCYFGQSHDGLKSKDVYYPKMSDVPWDALNGIPEEDYSLIGYEPEGFETAFAWMPVKEYGAMYQKLPPIL